MDGRPGTVAELALRHEVESLRAALATYQSDFRDRAALAALTGALTHREWLSIEAMAGACYDIADAMLKARDAGRTALEQGGRS